MHRDKQIRLRLGGHAHSFGQGDVFVFVPRQHRAHARSLINGGGYLFGIAQGVIFFVVFFATQCTRVAAAVASVNHDDQLATALRRGRRGTVLESCGSWCALDSMINYAIVAHQPLHESIKIGSVGSALPRLGRGCCNPPAVVVPGGGVAVVVGVVVVVRIVAAPCPGWGVVVARPDGLWREPPAPGCSKSITRRSRAPIDSADSTNALASLKAGELISTVNTPLWLFQPERTDCTHA